ncbi:hypothetical protein [Lichenicoccus sp.]|uniref:hypothetical protein n=1 Tax=Lichenicoccus sp. TaxID=2781899 RepID=UPI003D0CB367
MILRINVDEGEASIEEVFNGSATDIISQCRETKGDYHFIPPRKPASPRRPVSEMTIFAQARRGDRTIRQYENGTIEVLTNGVPELVAKPVLRALCVELGLTLLNGNGNAKNTRTLGADVIAALNELGAADES